MLYLVSDIHGCYYSFNKLIEELSFTSKDTLICLGDCIDRGPYSFKLLDIFMNNSNYILIKGNHEYFLELYYEGKLLASDWERFGGKETLHHFLSLSSLEKHKYYEYIKKLPIYLEIDNYFLLHSGLLAGAPVIVNNNIIQMKETVEYLYKNFTYEFMVSNDIHNIQNINTNKRVIVGHTPTIFLSNNNCILNTYNCIAIDCGATYKNGQIGCLRLDDKKEFYVNVLKQDLIKR